VGHGQPLEDLALPGGVGHRGGDACVLQGLDLLSDHGLEGLAGVRRLATHLQLLGGACCEKEKERKVKQRQQ